MKQAALQTGPSYEYLVKDLQKTPMHQARSFRLDEVKGAKRMGDSFNRVASPLFPKTGVQVVDALNWKVSDVIRLAKNSVFDFPKAAFQGGLYGSLGGAMVGVVAWAMVFRTHFKTSTLVSAVLGGVLGSLFKVLIEAKHKLSELKDVLT